MNEQQMKAMKIRSKYEEAPVTDLDTLRALDKKVKRPPAILAYIFGSLSAVVMGAGMSLVMTDIGSILNLGDAMIPGLIIGVTGMLLALLNYPLYKASLELRKKKYAPEILRLSEEIMEK